MIALGPRGFALRPARVQSHNREVLRQALLKRPAVDMHDDGPPTVLSLRGDVHVAKVRKTRLLGNA